MRQFLNSKSMLTPGIAGAVTMLITNALALQFDLPGKWIALVLSFVLGMLVFSDRTSVFWLRGLLYVLNSLIIFSMATGTNAAGRAATPRHRVAIERFSAGSPSGSVGFFGDWFGE